MLSPPGEAAAPGGPTGPLEVSPDALVERLQRRIAALERQLEARIAQIADLQARLTEQDRVSQAAVASAREETADARREADGLRQKATQYDALLQTVTMRTLRLPREWYGAARRRLGPTRP